MSIGDWKVFLIVFVLGLTAVLLGTVLDPAELRLAFDLAAQRELKIDACLEEHPEWERSVCEKIARGEIWVGMSEEMVRASWGDPKQMERFDGDDPIREEWVYQDIRYGVEHLFFEDGVLVGWKEPEDPGCTTCGGIAPPDF